MHCSINLGYKCVPWERELSYFNLDRGYRHFNRGGGIELIGNFVKRSMDAANIYSLIGAANAVQIVTIVVRLEGNLVISLEHERV